jgi:hypothetical protein
VIVRSGTRVALQTVLAFGTAEQNALKAVVSVSEARITMP